MKAPTRAPFYAAMYHGLCDVARAHGYALAIHGTVTSDLDIIACPWTWEAFEEYRLGAVTFGATERRALHLR